MSWPKLKHQCDNHSRLDAVRSGVKEMAWSKVPQSALYGTHRPKIRNFSSDSGVSSSGTDRKRITWAEKLLIETNYDPSILSEHKKTGALLWWYWLCGCGNIH